MSTSPSGRLRPFRPVPFGRYTLLAPLSIGGMGEIYLARLEGAKGFGKLCVIKKILPQHSQQTEFVERFVNEAKTLVTLSHGSIAQVLDMGLNRGEPFLALEYVDGKDLRKVIARARERGQQLPLTFVLLVMSRVLDALAYAHRKRDEDDREIGLVHRDISPANIIISYEGEVKVIDFGLAKSTLNASETNPGMLLGKFLYMSPEQARQQPVDRRSDLYAVGLCLYELVAGRSPFEDVAPGERLALIAAAQVPPLRSVAPHCPPRLEGVVTQALASEPNMRFQSAEELRGRLTACLVEIDAAAGPEGVSRFMREVFAKDYQQERRMLASLKDLAPREVVREQEEDTKVVLVAGMDATTTREDLPAVDLSTRPTPAFPIVRIDELPGEPTTLTPALGSALTSSIEEPRTEMVPIAGPQPPPTRTEPRALDTAPTPQGTPQLALAPWLESTRARWLLAGVGVMATLGLVAFFSRKAEPPPLVEAVESRALRPVVPPPAPLPAPPIEEELAVPLAPELPIEPGAKRPVSPLATREYALTRASYEAMKRRQGCEARPVLCSRFDKLTQELEALSSDSSPTSQFVRNARALRRELDARSRTGP